MTEFAVVLATIIFFSFLGIGWFVIREFKKRMDE